MRIAHSREAARLASRGHHLGVYLYLAGAGGGVRLHFQQNQKPKCSDGTIALKSALHVVSMLYTLGVIVYNRRSS
jgi:hypothetical protein